MKAAMPASIPAAEQEALKREARAVIRDQAAPAYGRLLTMLRSGPRQVALVEPFTRVGCCSGPPAGNWLAGPASAPGLWREFVCGGLPQP